MSHRSKSRNPFGRLQTNRQNKLPIAATRSRVRSPAAVWGPLSKAGTPTWDAIWPSKCCSIRTRTSRSIQRFIEEAQIGGQLQHPGIAPVYELGQFADQRPYFTMKLVKGKTLAALLEAREDWQRIAAKFIGIFEQVCQTMAYAHSRGVIHRDLKPANIMVGAFGEVQVMDWGLAKVLSSGGVADEKRAHESHLRSERH